MESKIIFEEFQQFRQTWIWVLLIGISILPLVLFFQELIFESNNSSYPQTILSEIIIASVSLFIYHIKLHTQIRTDGIYVRFTPFQTTFQVYKWETVAKVFVRKYRPIKEYGGWGYRFGFGTGKAFNISGQDGIQIIFKDGSKLLIGTAEPVKAAEAIKKIRASGPVII